MNAYLIQQSPNPVPGQEQIHHPLSTDNSVTIGRDPTRCQLVLDSNYYQTVSRVHLEIRPINYPTTQNVTSWEVCDHSSNGTYINDEPVKGSRILQSGDVIKLGKKGPEFVFHFRQSLINPIPSNDSLSFTQILPVLSRSNNLVAKGFLVPGILTCFLVVFLLIATISQSPNLFNTFLGLYLIALGYYVIYQLCGKNKPWWLLLGIALFEILILLSPILIFFMFIFRGILPGSIEQTNFSTAFIANFFGAGLMEELLKALPALCLIVISSRLKSPWRERIGLWEPLDGILMLAAAGAGFTFLETLGQYVPRVIEQVGDLAGLQILILRTLGSVAGHMAYSGYFGYFIGLGMLKPSKRWLLFGIGWFTSAALHGLWNASSQISSNILVGYIFLAFAGVLGYVFLIAAILKARQLSPNRSQNFATQLYNPNRKP